METSKLEDEMDHNEQSDEENDLNTLNTEKSRTGNRKILDSDSDSEMVDAGHMQEVVADIKDKIENSPELEPENEIPATVTPEETIRVAKKKSKIRAIVDSDSDEEQVRSTENNLKEELSGSSNTNNSEDEPIPEDQNTKNKNGIKRKSRICAMADSDSEEEAAKPEESDKVGVMGHDEELDNQESSNIGFEDDQSNLGDQTTKTAKRKSKPLAIVDSDSEEEQSKSPDDNERRKLCSNEEFSPNISMDTPYQKSRLSVLCDAESSPDEHYSSDEHRAPEETQMKPKKYRKRPVKEKPPKPAIKEKPPKPMTGKEAALQRKEIQAESQRMLRESRVSLPYHRPKSYSLAEFLQKRSKLPTTIGVVPKASPAAAIKMTRDQLEIVSKTLDERIKEVEQFFKSESEDEEEEDQQHTGEVNMVDTEKEKDKEEKEADLSEETMESPVSEIVQNLLSSVLEEVSNAIENPNIEQLPPEHDKNVPVSDPSNGDGKQNKQVLTEQDRNLETSAADKINNSDNNVEQPDQEMSVRQVEDTNLISKCTEEQQESDKVQQQNSKETSDEQFESMQYDFNLDDMEETENDSHVADADSTSKMELEDELVKKYTQDCDKEQTAYSASKDLGERMERNENSSILAETSPSNKQIESTAPKKKFTKLQLLKEKFAGKQPKLSGNPDEVIDLETGVAKPDKVRELVEKFIKHTTVSHHPHKSKVEVNVISLSGAEVRNETVAVNIDDEEEPIPVMEIPGAKLQKLREELQEQMAKKRSELWQQRQTGGNCEEEEEVDDDEKSDNPDDDILDDEEEETEMTEESNSEDEVEDDCDIREKPKTKSAFVDEEAEESDIQDDDDIEDNNEVPEDDHEQTEIDKDEENTNEGKTSENNADSSNTEPLAQKKVLRRILKPFDDDDSDDEEGGEMNSKNSDDVSEEMDTSMTEKDANTSIASCDDDYALPPNLPKLHKTPQRPTTQQQSKSGYEFLTPVTYLTGLQNLNSDSKQFLKESPVISPFRMPLDPSPLKDKTWQSGLQKKLFQDHPENNTDELSDLCSGTFPETQEPSTQDSVAQNTAGEDVAPSTQDLLDICSGTFTQTQSTQSYEEDSQKINENVEHEEKNEGDGDQQEEIRHLDEEQDAIISQLLNEDEMEQFKKKFDSPVVANGPSRNAPGNNFLDGLGQQQMAEVNATGLIDSDDENDELKVGRRKQKKLVFSDDSSDDEDPQQLDTNDEEIDLQDDGLDEADDEISPADLDRNDDAEDIAYDSEENEIVQQQKPYRMQDFVENEAELSESEWGSADEDEKDLDEMEFEKGDAEVYDEKELRSDLEKIHMRRLLDDDNREVKLLQEMLLEDGELHGSGRQRQFRWKNIDSIDAGADSKRDDEDIYFDEEDESEEQFRKMRHHREMFLKKQNSQNGDQDDLNSILSDSQILSVGQKIIRKSQSFNRSNSLNSSTPPAVPVETSEAQVKQTFSILNKRGSFLSRGDQVLQRLAEYTKTTSTNTVVAGSVKNSRSFLFQSASTVETATIAQNNKRKAADGTPKIIKKLRLDDMSPNVDKKAEKSGWSNKKLFGNN